MIFVSNSFSKMIISFHKTQKSLKCVTAATFKELRRYHITLYRINSQNKQEKSKLFFLKNSLRKIIFSEK